MAVDNPFFSIIIPTYNRAVFIGKAIESVLSQTFSNFELIVVDDGSVDDTEKIVKSFSSPKLRYIKTVNQERGAARNTGAVAAKGLFVNFLDSDDFLFANHLAEAHLFIAESKADIFHQAYEVVDVFGKRLRTCPVLRNINQHILLGNSLSCNGVFLKRELILLNPFTEDREISSLEDWELWIRLSARYPFQHNNKITSVVVQHEERSVMNPNIDRIKKKVEKFLTFVLNDETNRRAFGRQLKKVQGSGYTYAALHIAIAGGTARDVLQFLTKGLRAWPTHAISKRILVVFKLLLFRP